MIHEPNGIVPFFKSDEKFFIEITLSSTYKIAKKNVCSCGGEIDLCQHQLATVTARIEQETKN